MGRPPTDPSRGRGLSVGPFTWPGWARGQGRRPQTGSEGRSPPCVFGGTGAGVMQGNHRVREPWLLPTLLVSRMSFRPDDLTAGAVTTLGFCPCLAWPPWDSPGSTFLTQTTGPGPPALLRALPLSPPRPRPARAPPPQGRQQAAWVHRTQGPEVAQPARPRSPERLPPSIPSAPSLQSHPVPPRGLVRPSSRKL